MSFKDVIDFELRGSRYVGVVPPDWKQGRTAYGGVTAAACVRALRSQVPEERRLRYFQAQFVAAVDGPLEIEVRSLAAGGSVSSLLATVYAGEHPCATVAATFAKPRHSSHAILGESRGPCGEMGELPDFPYVEGLTPQFTRHIDYRWSEGGFPFTGDSRRGLGGYCRHKTAVEDPVEATIGLLDAWPPAVLPLLKSPAPASTVSWSAHIFDPPAHSPDEWWFYRADTVQFSKGYATTNAKMFAPDGTLVALSEQLVAIYEKPPTRS